MRAAFFMLLLAACGSRQDAPDGGTPIPPDTGFLYDAGVIDGPIVGEVSVMTWNIEAFPRTATTTRLVVEILESERPDVVGVQEIAVPQAFDDLVERLEGYGGAQVFDPGNFLRVGILWNERRVAVSEIRSLFDRDGYAFPRPPLKADVTVTSTSGELFDFTFVCVHLKAREDGRSRARRLAANETLAAWINSEASLTGQTDFVVVGDFNDRLEDDADRNVFGAFLDLPFEYQFLTTALSQAGEASFIPIPGMIDHLLVTAGALVEYGDGVTEVRYLESTVSGYREHVSDHRPVVSTFRVRRPRQ